MLDYKSEELKFSQRIGTEDRPGTSSPSFTPAFKESVQSLRFASLYVQSGNSTSKPEKERRKELTNDFPLSYAAPGLPYLHAFLSCLYLEFISYPDKLFDQTRVDVIELLIALLIPAHPLLFSFWKFGFGRISIKVVRHLEKKLSFLSLAGEEVGPGEDLIKRRREVCGDTDNNPIVLDSVKDLYFNGLTVDEIGRVVSVGDGIARVTGLNEIQAGELAGRIHTLIQD
ncbi:ATP synthase subunit alpha [Striga asiatica]|uniref:ATP synthase subunit alpha n=1 Tax=Striga asiatica TaxID=4170 RepID=A0A5A7Q005_STRAF|nr:ATP synthase subunit alpha [Striga asiatica]